MSTIVSGDFWAFVGVVAGIYTLFALGLQIQFGFTGLLNFGQVGFMAIGAYTMAILTVKEGMSMWLAAFLGVVAAALAGILVGLPTLRLRADYFAIVTIAFGEIVRYVATNQDGLTGGSQGTIALAGIDQAAEYDGEWMRFSSWLGGRLGISNKDVVMLLVVWAVALALLALTELAVRTPWGRLLKSIRDDEDAAASLGKNPFAVKLQSLALGAALAGLAGCFYAWQFSFFSPDDFQPLLTFFAWMIVILGGTGRVWAVPVGSLLFGILFAGTRFFGFPPFSWLSSDDRAYVRLLLIGLVLIGLMLFRPQGILGRREEMVLGVSLSRQHARGAGGEPLVRRRPRGRRGELRGRARLDHLADRPERRRQVDALQHRRRATCAATRAPCSSTGGGSTGCRRTASRGSGSRAPSRPRGRSAG